MVYWAMELSLKLVSERSQLQTLRLTRALWEVVVDGLDCRLLFCLARNGRMFKIATSTLE